MIAKLKLTKVTLEHKDDEIIILLGWHFVIIITWIEIINIIMEGKLQNLPKRDHAKMNGVRAELSFFLSCVSMISFLVQSEARSSVPETHGNCNW